MHSQAVNRGDLAAGVREMSQDLTGQFMGLEVLPIYETDEKAGTFGLIQVTEANKDVGPLERAPRGSYSRVTNQTTQDTYDCVERGLEQAIDDSDKADMAKYFDAEMEASMFCQLYLLRKQEERIEAAAFNASTFASYTTGVTNEWDDATNGVPMADVDAARLLLLNQVGGVLPPGVEIRLAVSTKVRNNIRKTDEIKALRGGGNGGRKDVDSLAPANDIELANILNVDKLVHSPAQIGGADIWDDEYALLYLFYKGRMLGAVPHLGRSFLWTTDSPENAFVESYRDEVHRSDIVRVRQNVVEKILAAPCGHLLSNITS